MTRVPADLWTFYPSADVVDDPIRAHNLYVIGHLLEPYWHGVDVADALLISTAAFDDDVVTWHAGWETEDGLVPWLPTSYVRALADDRPDFLEFMDRTLHAYAASRLRHRPPAGKPVDATPLVDVRAETFSVTAAAQLLSRDPVIQCGREALIEQLRHLGWVTRDSSSSNVPSRTAVEDGWLLRNDAWTLQTRTSYNRVRITPAGLLELHRILGGVAELTLTETTPALI